MCCRIYNETFQKVQYGGNVNVSDHLPPPHHKKAAGFSGVSEGGLQF